MSSHLPRAKKLQTSEPCVLICSIINTPVFLPIPFCCVVDINKISRLRFATFRLRRGPILLRICDKLVAGAQARGFHPSRSTFLRTTEPNLLKRVQNYKSPSNMITSTYTYMYFMYTFMYLLATQVVWSFY